MNELIQGFILAGGKSSRMGVAKAELVIGGISFLDRAADALSDIASRGVTVIGSTRGGKLRSIGDLDIPHELHRPGGALVGLYTALASARTDWIAVLACDMPFVTRELFNGLASVCRSRVDAIVPLDFTGSPQPLCSIYRRVPCLAAADDGFAAGKRSLKALLDSVKTQFVSPSQLPYPISPHSFLNVNTPTDLETAIHLAEAVN